MVRSIFPSGIVVVPTLAVLGISACSQSSSVGSLPGSQAVVPAVSSDLGSESHKNFALQSPIKHVVVIVQENRTVDDLFQFLPNANVRSFGLGSTGNQIPLQSESLAAPYDLSHTHGYWYIEENKGQMNGFEGELCTGTCPKDAAYAYVPQSQVQPYYTLAETYTFADNMFETDEGPSFPSHQYLVSGTSTVSDGSSNRVSNNPVTASGGLTGGCDSPSGSLVEVITALGKPAPRIYPCFARQSLMNEMDAAGISWKYYQAVSGPGLWNAVDAIQSISSNKPEMAANVISPSSQILTDIANGKLADVVWVTPTGPASDHPQVNNGSGPSWVASVVNAIGNSQYWSSTAIFITWDDWGGFYDHVAPKVYNSFELGFRVPLIVVSPYAKPGYVSHVQHEFGSILKFTEETFGLPSLRTTDRRADDLSDCFSFTNQQPRRFKRIRTKFPPSYFFHLPSEEPED